MLDPRTHHHSPTSSLQLYDETRHKTWESTNSNLWPSKPAQFRTKQPKNMDESETSADIHYRSLSPTSRTQAIVKGQRELMEMVRNMPESNYELSLKDLVEHHHRVVPREEKMKEETNVERKVGEMPRVKSVKKRNGKKINDGGGFYLNVAFPFSLGGSKDKKKKKKKNKDKLKKNESSVNCSSKVTPKPSVSDGSVKEWWKKSPSAFKDTDSTCASSVNTKSSGSSSSSNSSGSRRSNSSRREKHGGRWCLSFIRRLKIHTKK